MTIETERLILRPFREGDGSDVFEYLHEPEVNCFACMKLDSPDDAEKEVRERSGETEYYFAIVLKASGKVIGEIDAYPEAGEPHADDDAPKDTFSPCWMLNREYHGRGYAFEAAHAFFDYLFREKGARRIYAYVEEHNAASRRLCEKLGMRLEGVFREFVSFVDDAGGDPVYENTCQYAILKKEWLACDGVSEQIRRITRFERIFDRIKLALSEFDAAADRLEKLKPDVELLSAYYSGDDWKRDFADDEAGRLPNDLKRGVLSEDGIYDLLEEYGELTGK